MYCYRCHFYACPKDGKTPDACSDCGCVAFVQMKGYGESGATPKSMRASFMGKLWGATDDGTTDKKDRFWEDFA